MSQGKTVRIEVKGSSLEIRITERAAGLRIINASRKLSKLQNRVAIVRFNSKIYIEWGNQSIELENLITRHI